MNRMNPEIKTNWLVALRNGEYTQGRNHLKRTINGENLYCCLGVLALCQNKKPTKRGRKPFQEEIPSERFLSACGLDFQTATILAAKNDGVYGCKSQSFKQIANWIERNL